MGIKLIRTTLYADRRAYYGYEYMEKDDERIAETKLVAMYEKAINLLMTSLGMDPNDENLRQIIYELTYKKDEENDGL